MGYRFIKRFEDALKEQITSFGAKSLEDIVDYDHYILWSAGTESTFILIELLELRKQKKIKGNIYVIVNTGTHSGRDAYEEQKRKEIAEYVKEKYLYDLNENRRDINIQYHNHGGRVTRTLQWLFPITAIPILPEGNRYILYQGNNKEDDINLKYQHTLNAVREIDYFSCNENTRTNLISVLIGYRKSDCIRRLIEIDPKIISLIATCESSVNNLKKDEDGKIIAGCGVCSKCLEFKRALVEAYKYEHNSYEDINIDAYVDAIKKLQNNRSFQ